MKKKLFLVALGLFLTIGFASPYSFETSCGVWVTTVDPGFFGNDDEWRQFIDELEVLNCNPEEEDPGE
jgi:hypothetical protein